MDFTVLALEANPLECIVLNEYVIGGRADPRMALAKLQLQWFYDTEEILALVEWMRRYNADPSHRKKLRVYGVDQQIDPLAAVAEIKFYLKGTSPELLYKFNLLAVTAAGVGTLSEERREKVSKGFERFLVDFDEARPALVERSNAGAWTLIRQFIVVLHQRFRGIAATIHEKDSEISDALRDEDMADNVRWILETEPPGTRVVYLAHNGHVARNPPMSGKARTTGWHLDRFLGDAYVSLGFAFNQGAFQALNWTESPNRPGGLGRFEVGPAPPEFAEAAFARTALPVFVLDLRRRPPSGPVARWLEAPHPKREVGLHYAGPVNLSSRHVLTLTRLFDGLVFVDTTSRARPNGR